MTTQNTPSATTRSMMVALFYFVVMPLGHADQNIKPDFKIHSGKNDRLPGLKSAFPKYVQVFGLYIQATDLVSDAKLQHAADITADFLDNDRDGKPDNPKVNNELWNELSAIVMGYDECEYERLHDRYGEMFVDYSLQSLFATETMSNAGPHNPKSSEFDASVEEILHIITSVGYKGAYPKVFGARRGSELANAMDIARGGYFHTVPRHYPTSAWYSYDDRTCNYGCQITEYVYWALTSLLDGQAFKGRGENIEHEWKLNTPEKLRTKDKAVVNILTDPKYHLSTRLPDGKYRFFFQTRIVLARTAAAPTAGPTTQPTESPTESPSRVVFFFSREAGVPSAFFARYATAFFARAGSGGGVSFARTAAAVC